MIQLSQRVTDYCVIRAWELGLLTGDQETDVKTVERLRKIYTAYSA